MFTRNHWICEAANRANKITEVKGNGSTKPKLVTVSGSVGLNSYYTDNYQVLSYNTTEYTYIHTFMQNVRTSYDVSNNFTNNSSNNQFIYGLFFGSGNDPATVDDYKLSGSTIQNISFSYTNNSTYAEDGSSVDVVYNYTITNNNAEAITIGEVGLFAEATWCTSYNTYTHHYYMFERTAFESPITIPAGGVGQVTYTIQLNYPVN